MRFITSPERVPLNGYCQVFLAGSIEQGKAREWHAEVGDALAQFSDGLIVLNPRRAQWDATLEQSISNPVFKEQVNWEVDGIDASSVMFFYFQEGTLSPITLLELGYALAENPVSHTHVVIVCEPGFWRRGNIEVMADRANRRKVHLFDNMDDGIATLVDLVGRIMYYEDY